ncbi:MAG: sensor histidine kinase, partial [Chloroflexi bacterium]
SSLLEQLILAAQTRKILAISSEIDSGLSLPTDVKLAFYRIAQESLNNLIKHAHATHVSIFYGLRHGVVELSIEDNGRGFDVTTVPSTSLGLKIMQERAEGAGARMQVRSQVGAGTHVIVTWTGPNS